MTALAFPVGHVRYLRISVEEMACCGPRAAIRMSTAALAELVEQISSRTSLLTRRLTRPAANKEAKWEGWPGGGAEHMMVVSKGNGMESVMERTDMGVWVCWKLALWCPFSNYFPGPPS